MLLGGLLLLLAFAVVHGKLRFVHVLYRHGDRSPVKTFPTDVHNPESSWPQGWGELSTIGMEQQYELGQWLRERYDSEIGVQYENIHVESTDYNRTIMSALANVNGFYARDNIQVFENISGWSPKIPIHSHAEFGSNLSKLRKCSQSDDYKSAVDEFRIKMTEEMQYFDNKNRDILTFITEKTGNPNCSTIMTCNNVWDALICEKYHQNITFNRWPKWVNDTIFNKITQLYYLTLPYEIEGPFYKTLGGFLLRDIIDRLKVNVIDNYDISSINTNTTLNYFVYSAHDTWVMAFLYAFGAFNDVSPPYCSTVLLELHENDAHEFYVKLFFKNSTVDNSVVYEFDIESCAKPCLFHNFIVRSEVYMNYANDLCKNMNDTETWLAPATRFLVLISVGLIIVIVYIGVKLWMFHSRRGNVIHNGGIDLQYTSLLANANLLSSDSESDSELEL